jgi:uncharacterized protein (TIGR00730 family)
MPAGRTAEEIRMPKITAVAVFCGSHAGTLPAFRAAAAALGRGLAEAGLRLVYGGGRIGLMGALADAALAAGGHVTGVIPNFLTRLEVAHDGVSRLIETDSMHARKRRMFELADAFVMLPGGLGTLDETVEILTWRQLGLHDKPILLCDVAGSSMPLAGAIEAAIRWGLADATTRSLFEVVEGVPRVLERLSELATAPSGAAALT